VKKDINYPFSLAWSMPSTHPNGQKHKHPFLVRFLITTGRVISPDLIIYEFNFIDNNNVIKL